MSLSAGSRNAPPESAITARGPQWSALAPREADGVRPEHELVPVQPVGEGAAEQAGGRDREQFQGEREPERRRGTGQVKDQERDDERKTLCGRRTVRTRYTFPGGAASERRAVREPSIERGTLLNHDLVRVPFCRGNSSLTVPPRIGAAIAE